jgi:hypothetical protein
VLGVDLPERLLRERAMCDRDQRIMRYGGGRVQRLLRFEPGLHQRRLQCSGMRFDHLPERLLQRHQVHAWNDDERMRHRRRRVLDVLVGEVVHERGHVRQSVQPSELPLRLLRPERYVPIGNDRYDLR